MPDKINVYQQLFNIIKDEVKEKKDVQAVTNSYLADLLNLLVSDPGPCGIAAFRGVTFNQKDAGASDAAEAIFAVFRGKLLDGSPVVSFANGSTIAIAAASWLQRCVDEGITWKDDKPRANDKPKSSLFDLVEGVGK